MPTPHGFRTPSTRPLLLLAAVALLGSAAARPAGADFCPAVPQGAWPSGAPEFRCTVSMLPCAPMTAAADCTGPFGDSCQLLGTYDAQRIDQWCTSFGTLWNGLRIDESDWDEGHGAINSGGWQPTCNVDHFLSRLFGAAEQVRNVTSYAIPHGLHRSLQDPDGHLTGADVTSSGEFRGNWWSFVVNHGNDEWVPGCNNVDVLATNVHNPVGDDYIELHRLSAFRRTSVERASTIVHEIVHEDVGHVSDSACVADGSCDTRFGRYNAQTVQIDFLYDLATTYQTQMLGGQSVRTAAPWTHPITGARICQYIPTYTDYERDAALATANRKFDRNFSNGPVRVFERFEDAEAADAVVNPRWSCDLCDVSQWNFDPGQCQQTACNELLAVQNAGINSSNWLECLDYNVEVQAGGNSPEAFSQAAANLLYQPCLPPEEGPARSYCNAEKATATHVDEIDGCGWLEGVYLPGFSKKVCIQEFCQERFEADGGVGWSTAGDLYGCLDSLCAPDAETCSGDLSEAQCRQLFIAAHGNLDLYAPSCTGDGCQRALAFCLIGELEQDPNAWEYPDPVPPQCILHYEACRLAEQLSAMVFISLQDLVLGEIGTGPVEQTINPGLFVEAMLLQFQALMLEGRPPEEIAALMRSTFLHPEMVMAVFDLAPDRFVALYGSAGFESLIGPRIHDVSARPVAMEELSPEGQQALQQLEALIDEYPPGELPSPFGQVRSQAAQLDRDGDGVSDDVDVCPAWPDREQRDVDRNGIGDLCECGDQTGDGTVDVRDILQINDVIFELVPASPLCDTNHDGLCNVADILGANAKLFGAAAYCERYPPPVVP